MPGLFPHIRQVHRGDPVGHLPGAAQVVPLDAGGALALLDLPGLIDRPDRQAAAPAGLASGLIQALHREPAHYPDRRCTVPDRPVEQPLGLIRRAVPGMLGDRPAIAPGDLAHPARRCTCPPAATAPPGRNTAATAAAAQPGSSGPGSPLSWRQQPPPILLSSHTHDREAAASDDLCFPHSAAGHNPNGCCRTSPGAGG
jgi:hypothetical protein